MATTGQNFVYLAGATLVGSAVKAAGSVAGYSGYPAGAQKAKGVAQIEGGASGNMVLDTHSFDFSSDAYAKHAAAYLTLTGTTAITLDLTALAAATGVVVAGDASFATWNQIILYNTGSVDLTVNTAGSNGLRLPNGGTSPTYTVPANSRLVLESAAGFAVDSTHKGLTVTPTSGGSIAVCVAGA
jgi:hypothetical protein